MSAIWGVINTEGKDIFQEVKKPMEDQLSIYKLDLVRTWSENNVFLGCGLQYITPESLHEVLPYYDENKEIAITADAIIDNRKDLFELLDISADAREKTTDSELILIAYQKWGKDCPKYLVGDFAFVIFNKRNNEIFCARDQVGARTFYYYYSNNIFIFGTVIKTIIAVYGQSIELNERWIADFLALPGVLNQSEHEETVYKNIFQLAPAHTMTISNVESIIEKYWDPLKNLKELKLKSDVKYYEAFKEIFTEAVNCRLRSSGDVAISLSGGLDSGSVACVAAKTLEKEGKRLKAFSFIPLENLKYEVPKNRIADESEYIEAIKNTFGNIDVTYCRCEGKDSFRKIDWLIKILEQPYKHVENSFWADEITERVSQSGCKVLLNGQYGNCTISHGNFLTHTKTLFKRGKLFKIFKEINDCCRIYNIPKVYVIKTVCKSLIPYRFRRFISNKVNKTDKAEKYNQGFINKELIDKWNIEQRFEKSGFNMNPVRYYDLKKEHRLIVSPVSFTQIGTVETKTSLAYGIMKRDPTKDKRVIEFCLSLPSNQFVRNGEERRIIRRAMEGILPDKIRLNMSTRGIQCVDWVQRLEPKRVEIWNELNKVLEDTQLNKYINIEILKKEIDLLKDESKDINVCNVRMLLITLAFAHFINSNPLEGG